MSWVASTISFLTKWVESAVGPAPVATPTSVLSSAVSSMSLLKGLESLAATDWADLVTAAKAKFVNPGDDIVLLEDLAQVAAAAGLPYASLAEEALQVVAALVNDLPTLQPTGEAPSPSPSAGHSK